ncbi:Hg(II)-responsive transcriptional regulator [Pseudomaricurvus alcaniphilus]|uniref:Hg(II)-responsive transcriptional regulator n=1 Tax=Pseudomaricurvus alcaniphilus TaxID=1166482 RepID=UPI0014072FC9|nr:Hg(II)-responsive transcriptional regulator [Pseudomaricurvus alcaniphilus]NHN36912.1 Hg(II)-responsive transcriptional regulator [Pseudomaricurvus alcaniphilus]
MTRTISKVAKELLINIETIRFYERKGLIEQPVKPETGFRHYPDKTVDRIRFIKRSQELGFTLDEIALLLSLEESPCHKVQALAEHKLETVQAKIKDLKRLQQALVNMLEQCAKNDDKTHCPIIDSLQP